MNNLDAHACLRQKLFKGIVPICQSWPMHHCNPLSDHRYDIHDELEHLTSMMSWSTTVYPLYCSHSLEWSFGTLNRYKVPKTCALTHIRASYRVIKIIHMWSCYFLSRLREWLFGMSNWCWMLYYLEILHTNYLKLALSSLYTLPKYYSHTKDTPILFFFQRREKNVDS